MREKRAMKFAINDIWHTVTVIFLAGISYSEITHNGDQIKELQERITYLERNASASADIRPQAETMEAIASPLENYLETLARAVEKYETKINEQQR
jgi:DNA-binding transcriptional regulator GbsR (MarR family)